MKHSKLYLIGIFCLSIFNSGVCSLISIPLFDLNSYKVNQLETGDTINLPFSEPWDSGQFGYNLWSNDTNWVIADQGGNPSLAARFNGNSQLSGYVSSLESCSMKFNPINDVTPYKIWLDYDLKLDDISLSSSENIFIEIWNGANWQIVKTYTNKGDFDWVKDHLDITEQAKNKVFKIRFKASGSASGNISSWKLDNILIYYGYELKAPQNIVSSQPDSSTNNILISWQPFDEGITMTYLVDDGVAENGIFYTGSEEVWLGSEFPVTDTGTINKVYIYLKNKAPGNVYRIDIFDSERNFTGSSPSFVPQFDEWNTVNLPDLPFQGHFYAMIHIQVVIASDILLTDMNGPNAEMDNSWFFDGNSWSKLSEYALSPGVFNIRVMGRVNSHTGPVDFETTSAPAAYISPLGTKLGTTPLICNTGQIPIQNTGSVYDDFLGFDLFRRPVAIQEQNRSSQEDFIKIANLLATTSYLDLNLNPSNCYEYFVKGIYTEGISQPSDTTKVCLNTIATGNIIISSNPATNEVRLFLAGTWQTVQLLNSHGYIVAEYPVTGMQQVNIPVTTIANGTYFIKLLSSDGKYKSAKLIVCK